MTCVMGCYFTSFTMTCFCVLYPWSAQRVYTRESKTGGLESGVTYSRVRGRNGTVFRVAYVCVVALS